MSDDFSIPSSFKGIVRLFPLPNVVLFPCVTLPLHIFEPRYRQMTADALADDQLITMALTKPGGKAEETQPPLHPVACLGKIIANQKLDSGKYNILLRGLSRVRLGQEIDAETPYRCAKVRLLNDLDLTSPQTAGELREQLKSKVTPWFERLGVDMEQLGNLLDSEISLGALSDVLTFALPMDIDLKQSLLGQSNVELRIREILAHLEKNQLPKADSILLRKFPPEFSSN